MTTRADRHRIARSRYARLRQDCLEDWLAIGGARHKFDPAWPGIQAQLLPQGARSPAVSAGRARGVVKEYLRGWI